MAGTPAARPAPGAGALLRLGLGAPRTAVRTAATALTGTARTGSALATGLGRTLGLGRALDLGPVRHGRHAWFDGGRGQIEVRGLADGEPARQRALAESVQTTLRRVRGVRLAQVNAVTGHVLVLFDESAAGVADLVEAVVTAEEQHGTADAGWVRESPPHPADPTALTAAAVALAADCAGLGAAVAGRLLRIGPLPPATRTLVGIVEAQPRLRRLLERTLGPPATDVVVGVGSGVLYGLTEGVGPLLVTALSHAQLLAEVRSRRAVWARREDELCAAPGGVPEHPPVKGDRVAPFPAGPVEVFADRVAIGSLAAAAGVLAVTRDVARAANLLLVGVPPAARLGREAFAASLGRHLAARGLLPMDPGAFRRLDRIDVVVLDADSLGDDADRLLSALARVRGTGGPDGAAAGAGRGAGVAGAVEGRADGRSGARSTAGAPAAGLLVVPVGGAALADASAAPSTDGRVPGDGTWSEGRVPGDATSSDGRVPGGATSTDAVRRLQAAGHGVLVVARGDNDVLTTADVAVSVPRPGEPVGWAADLLCGPDLEPVLTLLAAVPAARRASRRAVALAGVGSVAAAVLTTVVPPPASELALQPVYVTGVLAQLDGARAARAVTRSPR